MKWKIAGGLAVCVLATAGTDSGSPAVHAASPSWTVVPSANTSSTQSNQLVSISCPDASDCWAAGNYQSASNGNTQPLIEQNTGSGWTVATTPSISGGFNELFAVSCLTTTNCWAVGTYTDSSGTSRTLIEQYSGSAWSLVSDALATGGQLWGVTCVNVTDCWAVGDQTPAGGGNEETLIEQNTGGGWIVVPAPSPPGAPYLHAVACDSATDCWAIGTNYVGSMGFAQIFLEHYDSSGWSVVNAPNPSSYASGLAAVSCVTATDCWAVGSDYPGTGCQGGETLIEQYNGSAWSVVSSPNPTCNDGLSGLDCIDATHCWAVGTASNGVGASDYPSTLIEQYDGNTWSVASSPGTGASQGDTLASVSCVGAACAAAGYSSYGGVDQTLIEQSGRPAVSITRLTPAAGPATGGQVVTVSGSGFVAGMSAQIGGVAVTPSNVTPTSFTFTTPAAAAGYVYVQVSDASGSSATDADASYIYEGLGSYFPVTPFRILDTRFATCVQCGSGGLAGSETRTVQITGVSGLADGADPIPSSATGVVLNVAAVSDTMPSLLTVYPNGTSQPLASNLNFASHTDTATLVTVALGQNGPSDVAREVNIFNALGTLDVIADVEGYFAPQASSTPQGEYHGIPPLRVCDTRASQPANSCNDNGLDINDNAIGPGGVFEVNVTGPPSGSTGSPPPSIPGDGTAEAAVLDLTAVAGSAATFLSVFPTSSDGTCAYGGDGPSPPFSTINVNAGAIQANRVIVPLGPSASGAPPTSVCVYNSQGRINFILDANGWFGSSTAALGSRYQAIGPSRICDTRPGSGEPCAGNTLAPGGILDVQVSGAGGVPSSSAANPPLAVIANLTAVLGTQGTFLTAYPGNSAQIPNASDINAPGAAILPNLVVVLLSPAGDLKVYNSLGSIDAILDVEGWFQSG